MDQNVSGPTIYQRQISRHVFSRHILGGEVTYLYILIKLGK